MSSVRRPPSPSRNPSPTANAPATRRAQPSPASLRPADGERLSSLPVSRTSRASVRRERGGSLPANDARARPVVSSPRALNRALQASFVQRCVRRSRRGGDSEGQGDGAKPPRLRAPENPPRQTCEPERGVAPEEEDRVSPPRPRQSLREPGAVAGKTPWRVGRALRVPYSSASHRRIGGNKSRTQKARRCLHIGGLSVENSR